MSIGAQAGAGPLAAYYFHHFPLYFLPANLFVVLPTSAIMYIGFMLLMLPAGNLARCVGTVLEDLISVTNNVLGHIEQWPMASIRGLSATWWESLLVYVLIVAIAMAITERRKQWVYGALGCVTLLVCASFSAGLSDGGPKAIVFNVRRNLAIGLVDGNETWLYTNLPSIDDRTIGYSEIGRAHV